MTKRLKLMKDGVKTNENYFKNLQKKKKPCFQFLNCLLWELKGAVTKRGFLKVFSKNVPRANAKHKQQHPGISGVHNDNNTSYSRLCTAY